MPTTTQNSVFQQMLNDCVIRMTITHNEATSVIDALKICDSRCEKVLAEKALVISDFADAKKKHPFASMSKTLLKWLAVMGFALGSSAAGYVLGWQAGSKIAVGRIHASSLKYMRNDMPNVIGPSIMFRM